MGSRGRRVATFVLLFLLLGLPAAAQETGGRIEGRVQNDGKGIANVVVRIQQTMAVEITDDDGDFAFASVPPGTYTLIFTLGDNNTTREGVIVQEGLVEELDIPVDWKGGIVEKVKVIAAAERAAKIVDAPAAVTEITEEEISREAAHGQAPKLLEFSPGAEVTQSGLYDFNFNTRGFNSSLNRRVATYIDGRDVSVILLGAQEWAALSGLMDDISSLEFVRGPSAALYGANASSGVINITTKSPRNSLGTTVRVVGGQIGTRAMVLRHANHLGGNWYAKVVASIENSGDFAISRNPDGPDNVSGTLDDIAAPEYSEFCMLIGEVNCLPEEKSLFRNQDNDIMSGSLRVDRYFNNDEGLLTLEYGVSDIEGPVFQTGIGRVQVLNAKRPFYRASYSTDQWNVQAHYAERQGDQVNLTQDLIVNFELVSDTKRYGIEGQGNWKFAGDRGRVVIGAAHTEERVDTTGPDGDQTVVWEPISTDRQAIFSQFDWKLTDKLELVLAARVDENTLHDTQFSPKAALVWEMLQNHSLRFTYNEAFQVANYSEFFLNTRISAFPMGGFVQTICNAPVPTLPPEGVDCGIPPTQPDGSPTFIPIIAVGNDDLKIEQTSAWEVGYSGLFGRRLFVTLDYYNNRNQDFITDLIPQVGTVLGQCPEDDPIGDPTLCPVNPDFLPWVSTDEAETTFLVPPRPPGFPGLTVAQALRNAVDNSVGGQSLGFRLGQNLDGSPVVVARTYSNIGLVDTQGVDFGAQYFITDKLNLQTSYSWFDFDILDDDPRIREILLPNSPEHKASLSLSYAGNKFDARISGRWVDDFRWSAGVFQGDVESYSSVDLGMNYKIDETFSVGLNVTNALNNEVFQAFGGTLLNRRALINLTYRN